MDAFDWCLAALGMIVLVVVVVVSHRTPSVLSPSDFNTRFPPISDEEFLRRCGPGTNAEIALKVRDIIARQLAIPVNQIYPEQYLVSDLGCD